MRKTRQREVIIEELRKCRSHPSADELYEMVRKRLPRISLGTIYRNLGFLVREGTIHRLELAGSQMRFDGEERNHLHIRCLQCGRIDDVPPGASPAERDERSVRETGYRIVQRRVEFLGICPACAKKGKGI